MLIALFGIFVLAVGISPLLLHSARVAHQHGGTTMKPAELDPRPHLPLTALDYSILLAVVDGELHGYLILKDVIDRTEGIINIGPATLYRALRRLVDHKLLIDRPEPEEEDGRRRYYQLTDLGRVVLRADMRRMAKDLQDGIRREVLPADEISVG